MDITTFGQLLSKIGELLAIVEKCVAWVRSTAGTRTDKRQQAKAAEEIRNLAESLGECSFVAQEVMDYLSRVIPIASRSYAYADKVAEMVQGRLSSLEGKDDPYHDINWQIIQTLVHSISDKRKEMGEIADGDIPLPNDSDFGRVRELARQFCDAYDHATENTVSRNATLVSSRCKDMSKASIRIEKLCSHMNHDISHALTKNLAEAIRRGIS